MVEPDALPATRDAYDAVADTYAQMFRDTLRDSPLDRAILGTFAELSGDGQVADLGCGPVHITAYLAELGTAARLVSEPQPTDRRQFRAVQLLARKAR